MVDLEPPRCMLLPNNVVGTTSVYFADIHLAHTFDGVIETNIGTAVTQVPRLAGEWHEN